MQHSLFIRMGQIDNMQALVDNYRKSDISLASSSELAHVMMKQLKHGSRLLGLHEAAFNLAELVSSRKQFYLDSLAETFHQLLTNTAMYVMGSKANSEKPAASALKIVKHNMKAKRIEPPFPMPKRFGTSHVKELVRNSEMSCVLKSMVASGVPQEVAMSAVGEVYDIVSFEGEHSEQIWVQSPLRASSSSASLGLLGSGLLLLLLLFFFFFLLLFPEPCEPTSAVSPSASPPPPTSAPRY